MDPSALSRLEEHAAATLFHASDLAALGKGGEGGDCIVCAGEASSKQATKSLIPQGRIRFFFHVPVSRCVAHERVSLWSKKAG